jgi:hypothetical protein
MELKELLRFPENGNCEDFKERAEELILHYRIKKVSGGVTRCYFINEIEVYYHGKGHEDCFTHPHFFKEAGRFRVHYSGVDITFVSDWKGKGDDIKKRNFPDNNKTFRYDEIVKVLKEGEQMSDFSYGGILIRSIREEGETKFIKGRPLRVLCELFHVEGDSVQLQLVKGEKRDGEIQTKKRINLSKDAKDTKNAEWTDASKFREELSNYYLK